MSDRLEEIKESRECNWAGDTGNSEWWFEDVRDSLDWLITKVEQLRERSQHWQSSYVDMRGKLEAENAKLKEQLANRLDIELDGGE